MVLGRCAQVPLQQPTPAISTSERLWNAAYDNLKLEDVDLVGSYGKILEKRELVEKAQQKISKASRISTGVGDLADFVLSAKAMVDLILQNVPQAASAALPGTGVCLGLQLRKTRTNLAGTAHIISRVDWYYAPSGFLEKDHIDESLESILPQLKARIVALSKALLPYQIKSICSYYRHQSLVFLCGLANWDDWDAALKAVTDAEDALQTDSDQYNKLQAKEALR
ncbi:hypothetical protein QC761_210350 [Podospora bellae-mahoneyi]|uniref:NWD NACHT-NTPase N-terminal domain-containing protein n=1 Tax=Podospora bellae-mahoneyi TaxID=2093777 RepID=A0ABR0FR45_9PEZI|nr:hypothetical protein QC761_210350 [Podospora bellae-mahoneyi]